MTPVEELRAAATKLRDASKGTTPGPWDTDDCDLYPRRISASATDNDSPYAAEVAKSYNDGGGDGLDVSDADWRWMALAHPGLADPLADQFDATAALAEEYPQLVSCPHVMGPCDDLACRIYHAALDLARVINGGHE